MFSLCCFDVKSDHKKALKVDFVTADRNLSVRWFEIRQGQT